MELNIKDLGQVFTNRDTVDNMFLLKQNDGRVLEPSAGDGAFSNRLTGNFVAVELDGKVCPEYALNMDFFDYSVEEKFDTIIGNPPYVKYQDIPDETKDKLPKDLFDARSNLYLFFIYKSILHLNDGGELIFIVPRDFLKATSSLRLNEFIYNNGTITDLIEIGDEIIFNGATPNTVIFRFEKDNFLRKTSDGKDFQIVNGQLLFTTNKYDVEFNNLFNVKVGGISAANKTFTHESGNKDFVCSSTVLDGKTRRMFYNTPAKELEPYKDELINRKIKKFTEDNWYMWGRNYYVSDKNRVYVNLMTRVNKPFFLSDAKAYDGAILAIFPKFETNDDDMVEIVNLLNSVNWEELGFVCDGRYLFSQRQLENTVLPDEFKKFEYYKKL